MRQQMALALGAALFMASQSAVAQPETHRLSKAMYSDCSINPDQEPSKSFEFDVTYFVFAGEPGPQVNFFDPSKLMSKQTGWMPKGHFVLDRVISDRELFLWKGRASGTSLPQIDGTIELTPASGDATRTNMFVTLFADGNAGAVSMQKFKGTCGMLSGKAAWDRYQNGAEGK